MEKNRIWYIPAVAFLVAATANVIGCLICEPMAAAVKPSLLPLVALTTVAFLWGREAVSARDLGLLLGAQLLGCLGDVLLLHSEVFLLFAGGMVAFLSGHVCYLLLFGSRSWKGLKAWQWAISVLVMAGLVAGLIVVIGVNGTLLVPMAVYACGLVLLPFAGLCGVLRLGGPTWWIIFCGGLLFLFSDAMIAVDTFQHPSGLPMHFIIMLTYLLAQSLLAVGAVRLMLDRR